MHEDDAYSNADEEAAEAEAEGKGSVPLKYMYGRKAAAAAAASAEGATEEASTDQPDVSKPTCGFHCSSACPSVRSRPAVSLVSSGMFAVVLNTPADCMCSRPCRGAPCRRPRAMRRRWSRQRLSSSTVKCVTAFCA